MEGKTPPVLVPPHGHSCWVLFCSSHRWEPSSVMCCNLGVTTIIKAGPVQTRDTPPTLSTRSTSSQHVAIQPSPHSLLASQRAARATFTGHSSSKAESSVLYQKSELILGQSWKERAHLHRSPCIFPKHRVYSIPSPTSSSWILCHFFTAINVLSFHPTIKPVSHRPVFGLSES